MLCLWDSSSVDSINIVINKITAQHLKELSNAVITCINNYIVRKLAY